MCGVAGGGAVVLHVGRLAAEKDPHVLIEAFQRAREAVGSEAVFCIAGDGPRAAALREALPFARHFGFLERDALADLYAAADLFVFPSLYEGLGGSLIEAMASGLPIVATRLPAIEEVVEEGRNALLVERKSIEPLAKAMTDLLESPERAKTFGDRSREIFVSKFRLNRQAMRMVDFYHRVAGRTYPATAIHSASEASCG